MHALSFLFALLVLPLSSPSTYAETDTESLSGFSIDLVHYNSPLSPFYNSSRTASELIRNDVLRSMSRANRFHFPKDKTGKSAKTDLIPSAGGYLMKLYVGTPPVERWAIADTGSDVVWFQCSPCKKCYPHKAPLFNPKKSSTYKIESCSSKACTVLANGYSFCGHRNHCMYTISYGDGSVSEGNLASDYIRFRTSGGKFASFPNTLIGCGMYNYGKFSRDDAGLVGFGNNPLSIVSQLGPKIGRKFTYCLNSFDVKATSKLRFGEEANIPRNKGVVSTPLVTLPGDSSDYYVLKLQGLTVGKKAVQTGPSGANIMIDSGTVLTYLEKSLYNKVEDEVNKAAAVKPVLKPPENLKLCYPVNKIKRLVDIVFRFKGGANLSIGTQKLYSQEGNLFCFLVLPTNDTLSILGNIVQSNFLVQYDLDAGKVSFVPADCTKE